MNEPTSTEISNASQSEASERNGDHDEECGNPIPHVQRVVLVESAEILELTREAVSDIIEKMEKPRLSGKFTKYQQNACKRTGQAAAAETKDTDPMDLEGIPETATDDSVEQAVRPGAVWVTGIDADNTSISRDTAPEIARPSDIVNGNANTRMEAILPIPDEELHNEVLDAFPRANIRTEKEIDSDRSSSGVNKILALVLSILLPAALGTTLAIVRSKDKKDESQAIIWDQLVEVTEREYPSSQSQRYALEWIVRQANDRADQDPSFIPSESFDWIVTNYVLFRLYQSTNESAIWETSNWFVDAPMLDYCNYDISYSPPQTSAFSSESTNQCDEDGNLTGLLMDSISLQGSIPNEIGLLTNLEFLSFRQNDLTSTIPKFIGVLTNLRLLDFRLNDLSGTLPSDLGKLTRLEELRLLESPGLVGTMPTQFAQLTSLRRIVLSRTSVSGTISEGFCDMVEERREDTGDPSSIRVHVDCEKISCPCCDEAYDCYKPLPN